MIWALLCFSSPLLDSPCVIDFNSTVYSWLMFCSSDAKHTSGSKPATRINQEQQGNDDFTWWRMLEVIIFFLNNNSLNNNRDLGPRLNLSASQWNVWTHQWGEQYHRGPPHLWTLRRRWVSRRVFVWLEFKKINWLMDPSLKKRWHWLVGDRSHMRACLLRHWEPPKLGWSWQAPSTYTTTHTESDSTKVFYWICADLAQI